MAFCFLGCLLLLLPGSTSPEQSPDGFFQELQAQHQRNVERNRYASLVRFFDRYKCPTISYQLINSYLYAADKNGLDYRILPAVSVQESSCGKHYPIDTNNLWGWNSANSAFDSISQGIDFVSEQLAEGKYYKGKSVKDKLHSYNPEPSYAGKIIRLMGEIE